MLSHWGVRKWDHRDTATGQCDATQAWPRPRIYSSGWSTPGKRVMVNAAMLCDGSSPRLSSHSSFPTTGASLNPWPAEGRGYGDTGTPIVLTSSGVPGEVCSCLPEKPAPMMMLLNLGCWSRMKSSSGVFCGSHSVRVWGQGCSSGLKVWGRGGWQGPPWDGEGFGTPDTWLLLLGGSHRVEAGLHHGWLGLQPGQVPADEAAQEANIRAGGIWGDPVPLLRVNRAAVVVAHLGDSRSGGAGQGIPAPPPCPAHLHQPRVLECGQPVDAVGGFAQPQRYETGTGSVFAGDPKLLLPPVADVDAQGLESQH